MKVRLEPGAGAEYDSALDFFLQRDQKAASPFADDYDRLTLRLLQFPHSGKRVSKNVRQALFSQFPFKLIYRVEGDEIVIYPVAHHKQRPGYWRKRVGAQR